MPMLLFDAIRLGGYGLGMSGNKLSRDSVSPGVVESGLSRLENASPCVEPGPPTFRNGSPCVEPGPPCFRNGSLELFLLELYLGF